MKSVEINKLIIMAVIAFGEGICGCFVYEPKLPLEFTHNIKVKGKMVNFKAIGVCSNGMLSFWFEEENDKCSYLTLEEVKTYCPYLFVSIITHVFDMIENVKEC